MENTFTRIEQLTAHLKEYMDTRIRSLKLTLADKTSSLLSNSIALLLSIMILFMFVVFLSFTLAFVLAKLTGEFYWGFLIVSFLYLILGIFIWKLKDRFLKLPFLNAMLAQLFENDTEDEKI